MNYRTRFVNHQIQLWSDDLGPEGLGSLVRRLEHESIPPDLVAVERLVLRASHLPGELKALSRLPHLRFATLLNDQPTLPSLRGLIDPLSQLWLRGPLIRLPDMKGLGRGRSKPSRGPSLYMDDVALVDLVGLDDSGTETLWVNSAPTLRSLDGLADSVRTLKLHAVPELVDATAFASSQVTDLRLRGRPEQLEHVLRHAPGTLAEVALVVEGVKRVDPRWLGVVSSSTRPLQELRVMACEA